MLKQAMGQGQVAQDSSKSLIIKTLKEN